MKFFRQSGAKLTICRGLLITRVNKKEQSLFERPPLPKYQGNGIENCLVLSTICPSGVSNSSGFDQPILPVYMGDFSAECPFQRPTKQAKTTSKSSLVFLPKNNDSHMYSCILSSQENGIPLNRSFVPIRKLTFHPHNKSWLYKACWRQNC